MSQIFHPSTNAFAKATIFGAIFIIAGLAAAWGTFLRSSYVRGTDVVREQPVHFYHRHHVGQLGIDCRYCHTSVEVSPNAGMPPTHTCMTCHSQVWTDEPALAPVIESWEEGTPIRWNRVYNLPEHVYFNHSAHVQGGIGCNECHGRVDQQALLYQAVPLTMEWCLDCHREPERYIRPRDEVYNLAYVHPPNQLELGRELVERYNIPLEIMTNCSTCHH